jgi:hypothetical protein
VYEYKTKDGKARLAEIHKPCYDALGVIRGKIIEASR